MTWSPEEAERLVVRAREALRSRLPGGSGFYGNDLRDITYQLEMALATIEILEFQRDAFHNGLTRANAERSDRIVELERRIAELERRLKTAEGR